MSSFCIGTGTVDAYTDSELGVVAPTGFVPESLPTTLPTDLKTYTDRVTALKTQGKIPNVVNENNIQNLITSDSSADPLADYITKENKLVDDLKTEYCHYEKRYYKAVDNLLTAIVPPTPGATVNQSTVDKYLSITRNLNMRLNYIILLTSAIANDRIANAQSLQSKINGLNVTLRERRGNLEKQRAILEKETAAADLHKRMAEYTQEKARANQNLLALYGVLNITAIAMLFYIART